MNFMQLKHDVYTLFTTNKEGHILHKLKSQKSWKDEDMLETSKENVKPKALMTIAEKATMITCKIHYSS